MVMLDSKQELRLRELGKTFQVDEPGCPLHVPNLSIKTLYYTVSGKRVCIFSWI